MKQRFLPKACFFLSSIFMGCQPKALKIFEQVPDKRALFAVCDNMNEREYTGKFQEDWTDVPIRCKVQSPYIVLTMQYRNEIMEIRLEEKRILDVTHTRNEIVNFTPDISIPDSTAISRVNIQTFYDRNTCSVKGNQTVICPRVIKNRAHFENIFQQLGLKLRSPIAAN